MSGRPRKYSKKTLEEKINEYFSSISRTVKAKDETGFIADDSGNIIEYVEYVIPPSVSALCLFLEIDRSTWENYCKGELHPELYEIVSFARMKMEEYLERELNTRQKNVQGIIFNLQNNYGWKDKKELELGDRAAKSLTSAMTISEKAELLRRAAGDFAKDASLRSDNE